MQMQLCPAWGIGVEVGVCAWRGVAWRVCALYRIVRSWHLANAIQTTKLASLFKSRDEHVHTAMSNQDEPGR